MGYLQGGFEVWKQESKEIEQIVSVNPEWLSDKMKESEINIIDVRKPGEYEAGKILSAKTSH